MSYKSLKNFQSDNFQRSLSRLFLNKITYGVGRWNELMKRMKICGESNILRNIDFYRNILKKEYLESFYLYLFYGYYEKEMSFKDGVLFKSCYKIIREMNYKGNSIGLIGL